MEQPTKDLNFAEYQYRVSNFENFRIYSKSGRYHYFNFQKSFRFDCRDYDKDALIEFGTGYKDKNGKEIFQNDIVCTKDCVGHKKYHRVTKSDEGYYTYDDGRLDSDEKSIEVVGHIHSKNFEIWRNVSGNEMEWRKVK